MGKTTLLQNFLKKTSLKYRFDSGDNIHGYSYFWRTYEQQEIGLIEERGGKLFPYEFKWSQKKKVLPPKNWKDAYGQAENFSVITPDNYLEFVA